jgi:threonyl-tRNA synthetase
MYGPYLLGHDQINDASITRKFMSRPFSAAFVRRVVRLRTRHAATAGFEVTRPDETATDDTPGSADLGPCLVASLGVERGDGRRPGLARATAGAIRERAETLGTDAVLLVAGPRGTAGTDADEANAVTAAVERAIREAADDLTVTRAPAGPYVAVSIETKAHPYADESELIRPTARHRAVDARRVHTPDGTGGEADDDWPASVETYLETRESDDRGGISVESLQRAGLASVTRPDGVERVDWTPAGTVVRDVITTALADRFAAAGASPVATEPTARSPRVDAPDPSRLLATLAGEGGALPVRLSEVAPVGGDRSGGWTRPVMVTVSKPGVAGVAAFESAVELAVDACGELGVGDVLVCELAAEAPVDDGWPDELAVTLEELVVAEYRADASETRALEATLYATADLPEPVGLGRIRLDTSGEQVPDGLGGEERPWVVTVEPIGSVETAVAARLARRDGTGLPVPLAPTQVRLVPVEAPHEEECVAVATRLRDAGVRADVDDREETVGARLKRAAGVPFVAVVGDRERDGAPLKVRGPDGRERSTTVDDLEVRVSAASEEFPQARTTLPVRLSERPPQVGGGGDSER